MGLKGKGLDLKGKGLGLKGKGLGLKGKGLGLKGKGLGLKGKGLGFKGKGLGLRVRVWGLRMYPAGVSANAPRAAAAEVAAVRICPVSALIIALKDDVAVASSQVQTFRFRIQSLGFKGLGFRDYSVGLGVYG